MGIIISGILLGGCSFYPEKSAINIISTPTAKVYINGKEMGQTPYKNSDLKPGEVEIKLVAEGQSNEWGRKVVLQNYLYTVIDWNFNGEGNGYVLSMEKTDNSQAGLLVTADPDKTAVSIDGEIKGFTPLRLDDIGSGDKQITLSYPGYQNKDVYVKSVNGYQLVIEANLATESTTATLTPTPTMSDLLEQPTVNQSTATATIKDTGVGFLRVRSSPSGAASEIGQVKPGETYPAINSQNGWIEIKTDKLQGWVAASYVEITGTIVPQTTPIIQ